MDQAPLLRPVTIVICILLPFPFVSSQVPPFTHLQVKELINHQRACLQGRRRLPCHKGRNTFVNHQERYHSRRRVRRKGSRILWGVNAPWDPVNSCTLAYFGRDVEQMLVIYVPVHRLLKYRSSYTYNGGVIVRGVVPFHEVQEMWICGNLVTSVDLPPTPGGS